MDKIVIIGSPGAGKSTFAQKLGTTLGIDVLHLDRYFFEPGMDWKEYSRTERVQIERRLTESKERWIIEGSYLSSSDYRLQAADTIIALDMPSWLCLWQAFRRRFWHRGPRPDLPDNCKDRLRIFYILKILVFPYRGRNLLLAKIDEIKSLEEDRAEKKAFYMFRSHKDADSYLRALALANKQTRSSDPTHELAQHRAVEARGDTEPIPVQCNPKTAPGSLLATLFPNRLRDSALV